MSYHSRLATDIAEDKRLNSHLLDGMKFYNSFSGMVVVIKPDKSFTLVGNNPDSVSDEELWDMAEGTAPEGWHLEGDNS